MYIYQNKKWPAFTWDSDYIFTLLGPILHAQGRLYGQLEQIGFEFKQEKFVETLTQDILKTSEIEGESLDKDLVRSSIARYLGLEFGAVSKMDRNVEGIVAMILDATQNYQQDITKPRLWNWHNLLFPSEVERVNKITIGQWRKGIVQVVSGQFGDENVHFEAPSADKVDEEITMFIEWVNSSSGVNFILKAAIAHLWFITIHPFDDGNGRIARAISDLFLARSENSTKRFYSLSAQIQLERKAYYTILEKTQKDGMDITPWLEWFLGCLSRAIDKAGESLSRIFLKTKFWEMHKNISLNERQKKVINRLLEGFEGKLTTSKWAKIAKCSQDSAYRDILDLIDKNILYKEPGGGRSTSYLLIMECKGHQGH